MSPEIICLLKEFIIQQLDKIYQDKKSLKYIEEIYQLYKIIKVSRGIYIELE